MGQRRILSCAFMLMLCAGYFLERGRVSHQSKSGGNTAAPARGHVLSYGKLPLIFEANRGQTHNRVKFISHERGYGLFLTRDEMVLKLSGKGTGQRMQAQIAHPRLPILSRQLFVSPDLGLAAPDLALTATAYASRMADSVVQVRIVGANPNALVSGEGELPGKANYFIGNDPKRWRTNVPTCERVKYQSVYPGVDLIYYGTQDGQLEFDFLVTPGGDPRVITLEVGTQQRNGTAKLGSENLAAQPTLRIAANGDLILPIEGGNVRFHRPVIYQKKPPVTRGNPSVDKNHRRAAGVDRQLVEGNFVLLGNNRVGFALSGYDRARSLVIDPVLTYSTYLGGSGGDFGTAIATDSSGSAYVTGLTYSPDFPTMNPLQPHCNNCSYNGEVPDTDVFVAKLNPSGSALVYSTYLGGSGSDAGSGIAVDAAGDAYVTGPTSSADFPVTAGAFQTTRPGPSCESSVPSYTCTHAFVTKLNTTGSALDYSTYLGGSVSDFAAGIAVDSYGSAYISGGTTSPDFPATSAPIQPTPTANCGNPALPYPCTQGFVSKFNAAGSGLDYSITVGGASPSAIAIDSSGSAYVTGNTSLTNFPVTPGAFQTTPTEPCGTNIYGQPVPCVHPFVFKLNAAGSAFVYSTYLGGSRNDSGNAIAVDSSGNAYVTGQTSGGFPLMNPIEQNDEAGLGTAFVSKLNPSGSALIYSTYLGGSIQTSGQGVAVDAAGDASVTGNTQSSDFPAVDAVQATCSGLGDANYAAFAVRINPAGAALLYSTLLGCSDDEPESANGYVTFGNAIAADSSGNVYVTGNTGVTDFPVSNPLQPTLHGTRNAFIVKISPNTQAPWVSLSSISLPFGAQAVNTTSPPLIETVTNGGKTALAISGVTIGGANASDFAVSADNCTGATLVPNASCAVSVIFIPPAAGNRNAELDFTDNASNSPQAVALSGAAGASGPVAEVIPSSLDFGKQSVGDWTASLPVTLSNTGNAPLAISTLVTSPNFGQTNDCGGSLAAGSSCTINVTISPPAAGPLSGMLTLIDNSNGVVGRSQSVALSGAGQDFTLTTAPGSSTSASVAPGQSATYTLSLAGLNGYSNTVTFTCLGAPSNSSCTVSPSIVAVGSATTKITVTVTTTAAQASAPPACLLPPEPPLSPTASTVIALALALAAMAWGAAQYNDRNLWHSRSAILALAAGLLLTVTLAGCGGAGPSRGSPPVSGTPSGTYTLNVQGTASVGTGGLSHYVDLTLNVL